MFTLFPFRKGVSTYTMFTLGIILIFIGLLYAVYQKIPNKAIFTIFCLILLVSASIAAYSVYTPEKKSIEANQINREKIIAQQQIFSEWYAVYQKKLDNIDYNWQQYHYLVENLKNKEITLDEAFYQLNELEADTSLLRDDIAKIAIPATLNDQNYDLTNLVHKKTLDYTEAQLRTIRKSKEAIYSNPQAENTNSIETNTTAQEIELDDNYNTLLHTLDKIFLTEAPTRLFTANEISALRANLTLPEEGENN